MTTTDKMQEELDRKRQEEERNPLLKLNLGELVREMQIIALREPLVLKFPSAAEIKENIYNLRQREEILERYEKYMTFVEELARREKEYNSRKPEPRFG